MNQFFYWATLSEYFFIKLHAHTHMPTSQMLFGLLLIPVSSLWTNELNKILDTYSFYVSIGVIFF